MDVKQQTLAQPDSCPVKAEDAGALLALPETPEQKKRPRSVGFYELDVLKPSSKCDDTEDGNSVKSVDLKEKEVLCPEKDDSSDQPDGNPSHTDEDQSPNYFDQIPPTSSGHYRKHSNQTCLCKDCVENYMNLCEDVKEPGIADQDKKDVDLLNTDRASLNSGKSLDDFEASRHTDSSEDDQEESMGARYKDAEVTLPYPDKSRPPECITRLSNAGLYEPNEDAMVKRDDEEQDKSCVAFFVEHPPSEKLMQSGQNQEQVGHAVKLEIEKADPVVEPLLRGPRRTPDVEAVHPALCRCHGSCLKIIGSFVVSMLVFPAFLYAAYAWLPFDAPIMADIPTRLVYTLRCAVFGMVPVVMGVVIHGISRLCVSSFDPFKPREREETIHRRFIKQSTFLFVLYFFNLSVLATYLPQTQLKFIPLLTCLFSLSQLIYWLSFAVGRSFRGFGYGLTFLPLLSMLICNLYFMFVLDPEKMVFLGSRDVNKN